MSFGARIAPPKKAASARSRRRGFPVHMYVGRNGSGKSLAAVFDSLPDLDAGVTVLSTVRLLDWRNPRPCEDPACGDGGHGQPGHLAAHPCYVPLTDWAQILEFQHGVILMDEITGVADSFDAAALPAAVANKLAQLRRDDCVVRVTGLNFIRANKRIREACSAVTRCRSLLPVDVLDDNGEPLAWRQRRLSILRTYDAQSLPVDDVSESAWDSADLLVKSRIWVPDCEAIHAYDTLAPVSRVGAVTDAGRCAYCAGTRRAHECSCEDYRTEKERRREGGTARKALAPRTGLPSPVVLPPVVPLRQDDAARG